MSNSDLCINGTTVGLNALIQHKGGKTGLICTAGHEDSIEIRLGHKEDGYRYDPEYPAAVMLVPRYLRKGVRERVISDGSIRTPLNEDDVRDACRFFIEEGIESVAISFVWSVLNQSHERRAAEIVRELMPQAALTVGSELYPQVREYTRTSTAVVNAYLAPILSRYVAAVDEYFRKLGAKFPVRYFQSNGGLGLGQAISERSVYAINSGPASAPQAGLFVTAPFKKKNVITIDMGGTSFDITLTRNGVTNINKNIDMLRYRIGIPMIQVETLGAGGGSIGWIDSMGLLQVGPQSAGATPGPACYGQGGTQPTVTDANLVLGYLNPKGLLGGRLPLDLREGARGDQEQSPTRSAYRSSAPPTACSPSSTATWSTASAGCRWSAATIRATSCWSAPAARPAPISPRSPREMGIDTVILPKLASGLCAFGQIISDVKYNYMATSPLRLEMLRPTQRSTDCSSKSRAQGMKHLVADGFAKSAIRIERSLDMRYVGQVHECTVDIGNFARSTQRRWRRLKTRSTSATRNSTPIPNRTTRSKSSTSKARSTDTSTNRNRRA